MLKTDFPYLQSRLDLLATHAALAQTIWAISPCSESHATHFRSNCLTLGFQKKVPYMASVKQAAMTVLYLARKHTAGPKGLMTLCKVPEM